MCRTAYHISGRHQSRSLWTRVTCRYCELSVTEFFFVWGFYVSLCLLGLRTCLNVPFSPFFLKMILFIVYPFAACWVHRCYSSCEIHSCERCILNSAAIGCRKRTWPFPDTSVWEPYYMFKTLNSVCFPSLISLFVYCVHTEEPNYNASCFYCCFD